MIAAGLLIHDLIDDLTKLNHVMAPPAQTILRAQIRRVHPRNSVFMIHLVMASSAVAVEISPVVATVGHVAMPNSVFNLREMQVTHQRRTLTAITVVEHNILTHYYVPRQIEFAIYAQREGTSHLCAAVRAVDAL